MEIKCKVRIGNRHSKEVKTMKYVECPNDCPFLRQTFGLFRDAQNKPHIVHKDNIVEEVK